MGTTEGQSRCYQQTSRKDDRIRGEGKVRRYDYGPYGLELEVQIVCKEVRRQACRDRRR